MHRLIFQFFFQTIIFYNKHNFLIANPLSGNNVRQARLSDFKFVICFLVKEPQLSPNNIFCTGTLITHKFVLSAEHCLENLPNEGFELLIGSIDIRTATRHISVWWLTYNNWMISLNSRARYRSNDIAILRLLNKASRSIIPATMSTIPNRNLYGSVAIAAGWGKSNNGEMPFIMEIVNLTIISKTECTNLGSRLTNDFIFITHAEICSTAHPFAQLESGDSGGPLLIDNVIVGVNIGKMPDMNGIFHEEKANMHSSVYFYRSFISAITKI